MKIGSLCTGYGGLDMAVEAVTGAHTAWVSDIDKGACKVLAHRFPGVPNIGDMTKVDWTQVEPVDVITGGTPCQDLSHAGKRAGMTDGTRSNLWVSMREAIATIRPALVVWENVGGAYSAAADSEMESRAGCVGDRPGGPVLRALGRVLGDLASLGYVGGWHGLRAADVGAPHGRLRVFVVATDARRLRRGEGWPAGPSEAEGGRSRSLAAGRGVDTLLGTPRVGGHHGASSVLTERGETKGRLEQQIANLLPTPRATDGTKGGPNQRGSSGDLMLPSAVAQLLPTPAVNDMGAAYTPETWDAWTDEMKARHGNGNGHGKSLAIEAQRLLPTPMTSYSQRDPEKWLDERPAGNGQRREVISDLEIIAKMRLNQFIEYADAWGDYLHAIVRWEHTLGRPAPAPTMTSSKGNPQLSPAFTEWMMGLPDGWITDTPGVTRNEALKLCGNGVVPQQAEAAIWFLLGVIGEQVAA